MEMTSLVFRGLLICAILGGMVWGFKKSIRVEGRFGWLFSAVLLMVCISIARLIMRSCGTIPGP